VSRADLTAALAADALTPREFDIVDRLIRGDRVPVIATSLFVSQSTIRNQLAAVFRKVGVHSQQELIAYIRRARRKQS
jgi:DNA-binding NarL/FixJ family response regulator